MWASNNSLRVLVSLIHIAILNQNYVSSVSKQIRHLICCTGTPEGLSHKVLISNFFNKLIHLIAVYSRRC